MENEIQFLILCARTRLDPLAEKKIRDLMKDGINWQMVLAKAIKEKILPLVFFNICKLSLTREIPEAILSEFNRMNYGNLGQNIAIYQELKNLLRLFNEAGIEVIVLKGAAYIERLYDKNIGLRSIGDIDLVIKDADLSAAKKLLADAGYLQKSGWLEHPTIDFHHLVPFVNPKNNVIVEVHWTIAMYEKIFQLDMNKVWQRAQKYKLGAFDMLILAPEDMI